LEDPVARREGQGTDQRSATRAIAQAGSRVEQEWLVGGGEMARVVGAKDWAATPLGPIADWPQSLRTTVSLVQASNSPISLAWGSGHVQIYNDGYWPICGAKHPAAMGQDFRECWASAFPVIGEAYATAWSGKSAYLQHMRMFLDRHGFPEETWFTFSFSPITDESGGVAGLFHPVTEMTSQMLWERRTRTLRDLVGRAGKGSTTEEVFALAAEVLSESNLDLPFVSFYLLDGDRRQGRLMSHAGLAGGTRLTPELFYVRTTEGPVRALAEAARTGLPQPIHDLAESLTGITPGPYPESPRMALALPILQPGSDRPVALMVAGLSARLPVDDPYRDFCELVASAVGAALANARAYERERTKSDALAELDRAKTAFVSNVSHEFRTPLTLMLGPLEEELAEREKPLPPPRRQRLEVAHRNSLRLLKLVNTLLDFSRVEAGGVQASYEATDLARETEELAGVFRAAVEQAGLTFTVDCAPRPEPIYVDRAMWEKIVLNLLSNALKHTFQGSITLRLRWSGDHCELTVADTGVGIRREELPRIFERFHRVEGARSRSLEGTGIGLPLVLELARLHGGTVRAESQEGKGSTFTVTIRSSLAHLGAQNVLVEPTAPFTAQRAAPYLAEALHWLPELESPERVLATAVSENAGAAASTRATPRPRILWVDDNADMRDYVRRLLAEHYEVEEARDGLAALASARRAPPDLVLSDVMMPGLDGYGLLRELRADPLTRTIPVILLSARAGEGAVVEGLDTGADDYLVKPFSARELLARVRTHLEIGRERREWGANLERVNREMEQFAYVASHDLQEPLRMVRSYIQLLQEEYQGKLDAKADTYIGRAVEGVARMQALIHDLLSFLRLSSESRTLSPTDAGAVLEAALADLRLAIFESGAAITRGALPTVAADGAQLRVVFQNLVANALKFRLPGTPPELHVSAERDGATWIFSVRDNGIGIEARYVDRIFRMFQRLHTRDEYPGTGMGLAICKTVVERGGGKIWVESEPGIGSTFRFTLVAAQQGA
jgi:signal transduction histidine kinase